MCTFGGTISSGCGVSWARGGMVDRLIDRPTVTAPPEPDPNAHALKDNACVYLGWG